MPALAPAALGIRMSPAIAPAANGADMAQADVAIYEPPAPGLPYLVVTLTPAGLDVVPVQSRTEAR